MFSDESTPKFSDYRPVFFEGRAAWIQDTPTMEYPPAQPLQAVRSTERITVTHPFTQFDERPQSVWTSTRVDIQLNYLDEFPFVRSFVLSSSNPIQSIRAIPMV